MSTKTITVRAVLSELFCGECNAPLREWEFNTPETTVDDDLLRKVCERFELDPADFNPWVEDSFRNVAESLQIDLFYEVNHE
jgi:hypothetical protein